MNQIHLDHNATTPIDPQVADAMHRCYLEGHANPASQHQLGRRARRVVEDARESLSEMLGAETSGMQADQLLFTSGGTEANNLALLGLAGEPPGRVIISSIEHPSVIGAAEVLQKRGFDVQRLPVAGNGETVVEALPELIDSQTRLVSVMAANNETGVLQPIERIAEICEEHRVLFHTDAVQVAGKSPLHFRQHNIAAMSLAAHKFHGPRGVGALLIRWGVSLQPLLVGGFQQGGLRPGTESPALAVGMETALRLWKKEADSREQRMRTLRDLLESRLLNGWPDLFINGLNAPRLPHTSNVSFPGLDRQALVIALDLAGVACSAGSACASGSSEPSPTLLAMGLSPEIVAGALRFSLGAGTSEEEIQNASERILQAVRDLNP